MFKEILKIIPTVDNSDLNKMERSLSRRFTNVAKKFGKGLVGAVKGGGIAGVALALVDKLLNPLEEVKAAIERTLGASDDLVTNAKQFGTTAGNLAKLQAFGKSTGLESNDLNTLLAKFQTSVAEASADPSKQTSVRQFVGQKDTAAAFFEFIQSLQKMEKNQQILVQQEVFGEKQILKMADFLNTDFAALSQFFKGIDNEKVNTSAQKLGDLNDLSQTLSAVRDLKDIQTKGSLINKGTISSLEAGKAEALRKENERIANFQSINAMNENMLKIQNNLEKLVTELFTQIPLIMQGMNFMVDALRKSVEGWNLIIKTVKGSRLLKGLFGGGD